MSQTQNKISVSPQGEALPRPELSDDAAEYERVKALAEAAREAGLKF